MAFPILCEIWKLHFLEEDERLFLSFKILIAVLKIDDTIANTVPVLPN